MGDPEVSIRLMRADDFDAVLRIDGKVLKNPRKEYYELRFDKLFQTRDFLPASLVAETADGTVVGFIMGELYIGQYGISGEGAMLDTIGVDPDYQHMGIGQRLINEFVDHLRSLGVQKITTLTNWNNSQMIRFFSANEFSPSKVVNLERDI